MFSLLACALFIVAAFNLPLDQAWFWAFLAFAAWQLEIALPWILTRARPRPRTAAPPA